MKLLGQETQLHSTTADKVRQALTNGKMIAVVRGEVFHPRYIPYYTDVLILEADTPEDALEEAKEALEEWRADWAERPPRIDSIAILCVTEVASETFEAY